MQLEYFLVFGLVMIAISLIGYFSKRGLLCLCALVFTMLLYISFEPLPIEEVWYMVAGLIMLFEAIILIMSYER